MTKVEDQVSVRGLGATRVDVEITAGAPDAHDALEWVEEINAAIQETTKEKKETMGDE